MCCLEKKAIKQHFEKATDDGLISNLAFWNPVKPFLSNKRGLPGGYISLVKNNNIVTESKELVEIFNDRYINIEISSCIKPCRIADALATNDDRQVIAMILENIKHIQVCYSLNKALQMSSSPVDFITSKNFNCFLNWYC